METLTTPANLPADAIASYRRDGFVHIRNVISREEAEEFRVEALRLQKTQSNYGGTDVFHQMVNVWRESPVMKRLTLHANLGAVAERLAGTPLRLWHDQILIKNPHNKANTEFHQDQPYWPHADSPNPISAWIALVDVPVERGCMTFIPGSFLENTLPAQNLGDGKSLYALCPRMRWEPRVTVPLRAGDCTFHHGRCAHMATPNNTDEPRVAHVAIFMERTTRYRAQGHIVTDPLKLNAGDLIEGELFPNVGTAR